MKITFMGTGAADFSPLLKTIYSRKLDKDQRRSSSILINDRYLVDCGPHVEDSFEIQGLDYSQVTDLLLTHFHSDHCDWDNIAKIAAATAQPLRIWHRAGGNTQPIEHAVFCPLEPGQEIVTGDLKVKALAANHTDWPLHYDLEIDGRKLFYGCDGAWVLNDTFYAMRRRKYDCMILDATVGDYEGDFRLGEHNSIPMIRLMMASFRSQNVIAPEGQVWLNHLARTLHEPHEKIVEHVKKDGYHVAYDGLSIEI